jgi:hypothetical protein
VGTSSTKSSSQGSMYPTCLSKARLQRNNALGCETGLGDRTLLRSIDQAPSSGGYASAGSSWESGMSNDEAIENSTSLAHSRELKKDVRQICTSFSAEK